MHLFLEGPAQTGKSTLIRECLLPYIDKIGGFSSQRLWQDEKPCGYRLTSAQDLQLDAPYDCRADGIFMYHNKDTSLKSPEVFEQLGIALLKDAEKKQLILLDEIGGSELLVPAFRKRLYALLHGPVPCIGVLKLSSKASFMSRSAGYSGEVVQYNRQLRQWLIDERNCRILTFTQENREHLRRELRLFLEEIFQ